MTKSETFYKTYPKIKHAASLMMYDNGCDHQPMPLDQVMVNIHAKLDTIPIDEIERFELDLSHLSAGDLEVLIQGSSDESDFIEHTEASEALLELMFSGVRL